MESRKAELETTESKPKEAEEVLLVVTREHGESQEEAINAEEMRQRAEYQQVIPSISGIMAANKNPSPAMLRIKDIRNRLRSFFESSTSSNSAASSNDEETSQQSKVYSSLLPNNKPSSSVAYFNNAGKTPIPSKVEEAGRKALVEEAHPWQELSDSGAGNKSNKSTTGNSSSEDIMEGMDDTTKVRHLFSKLIGAPTRKSNSIDDIVVNCIAICPSTGFSLTMIAQNLTQTIGKDDLILLVQDEFSSAVYCWQKLCDETNASLLIVDHPNQTNEEGGWTEAIIKTMENNPNVKVVCIPQVHWSDGSLIDLKVIGDACKEHDCLFVVDATQSVGIYPLNVHEIQCHALAASVHKWLLGPHGMSFVYIDQKYHSEWAPLDQHERSRKAFQDEEFDAQENTIGPNGYPTQFIDGAARLDSGGKKNPIFLPMMVEALTIVNQLDLTTAQTKLGVIADKIIHDGKELGFDVQKGPRVNHIIGLRPATPAMCKLITPSKMVEIVHNLKGKGVYIAARSGAFRVAPYLNTKIDDVDRLISALREELD